MKAISVRQPWAELIASGAKSIETRTWSTTYRGPLLIVASKKPVVGNLRGGVAVCRCELVNCRPMTALDEAAARCPVYAGAVAWVLLGIMRVTEFAVTGRLGLYDVDVTF